MARPLHVALLVSGEGTTLESLAETIDGGRLPARVVLVVADRPHAPAIERARRRGLPTLVLPFRGTPPTTWSSRLTTELRAAGADLVILAGFLAILPPAFVHEWAGRLINLHPSLLPKFGGPGLYGTKVHAAVLAANETQTGATVHLVTDDVDAGPALMQAVVPVERGDTPERLRERLHPVESELLVRVIRRFADGEWPLPYPLSGATAPPRESRGRAG
jgi:phosphoribosylglycinamide formyltransferase-1